MLRLALASIRRRRSGILAGLISIFLGAAVLMAFASLLDIASNPGVSAADRSTLTVIATVVGSWGVLIVGSAVITTQSVSARQRSSELALLRSVGATPAQVTRLITVETLVLGALTVVLAVPVGMAGGYVLLNMLRHTHQVAGSVDYRFGTSALVVGAYGTLVVAGLATWATARRSGRRRVQDALMTAAVGPRRMGRWRVLIGLALLGAGLMCAVLTSTVLDGKALQTQGIAAEAAILSSIGCALLAPALLRFVTAIVGPVLEVLGRAPAALGVVDLRRRGTRAATPVMPIVVCTAIAYGTLSMQAIWNSTHRQVSSDDKGIATLNYVVVGMIVAFAAVLLVNLIVVDTTNRRREFAQLGLAGATPAQTLRMVACQDVLLLGTGLTFGTLAGLLTVIPYSVSVDHSVVPSASIWLYVGVICGVALLTVTASLTAARRTQRGAAIVVMRDTGLS